MRETMPNCILNALLPCSENPVGRYTSPTPETGVLPGVSSSALSISSGVVSERFLNFLNFARQFPEKEVEEARGRCWIHGIRFDFFDIPMNFSGILVSTRLRKKPDALLSMRMKS
jgi:hypothetical protein